ncbi:hypothetical protein RF11_06321 [Thelohanellus kitauei]|uniref:UGGT thioredoxin-like domain-containing protein n=1 Tax=Thelohanellus kitauei TaxID=669202 RepID=A0A0C2IRT7_THEKT|nr:hypothetical protein RF11_06321 [Thelohanellus kitauei]
MSDEPACDGSDWVELEHVPICSRSQVLIFENSEYFAEYDYEKYWQFLDRVPHHDLSSLKPCSFDDYQIAINISEEVSQHSLPLVKFSLAIHDRLPKSEFYQAVTFFTEFHNLK